MRKSTKIAKRPVLYTLIAISLGFLVSGIILSVLGYNPFYALGALLKGIFSRPKYIFKVIEKSTPIILTGVSIAFAFKCGLFNIGAEGQYLVGSIAATVVGIVCKFPPPIEIPLILLAGILAGALFGLLTGFLKAKFGIHEVLLGIMLNWFAFYLCNFVVNCENFHRPNSSKTLPISQTGFTTLFYKFKKSKEGIDFLRQDKFLSDVLLKTDLNIGFLVAVLVAILIYFVLYKTTLGYSVRAVGLNRHAAEFCGIGVKRHVAVTMSISGGICGLAAALVITGVSPHGLNLLHMFENIGFNGLSVALIAGCSPIGCIFSGLFLGSLLYGGNTVQSDLGIPSEIISITIGAILFFVALSKVFPKIVEKLNKEGVKNTN